MSGTLPSSMVHAGPLPARHAAQSPKDVSSNPSTDFESQLKSGELPPPEESDDEKHTPATDSAALSLTASALLEVRIMTIVTAPLKTNDQAMDDGKEPEIHPGMKPHSWHADVKGTELPPEIQNDAAASPRDASLEIVKPRNSGERRTHDPGTESVRPRDDGAQLQLTEVPITSGLPQLVSISSPNSPARQVLDHLLRSLGAIPEKSAFKSLRMSLSPQGLGDVDLTMRMRGKELAVRIEVDTAAAVAAIGDHKDILNSVLREHGLALPPDGVTVVLRDGAVETGKPRYDQATAGRESFGGGAAPDRQPDKPNHNLQVKHANQRTEGVDAPRNGLAGRVV